MEISLCVCVRSCKYVSFGYEKGEESQEVFGALLLIRAQSAVTV